MARKILVSFFMSVCLTASLCSCGESSKTTSVDPIIETIPDDAEVSSDTESDDSEVSNTESEGTGITSVTTESNPVVSQDSTESNTDMDTQTEEPIPQPSAADWAGAYRLEVNENAQKNEYTCGLIYVNDDDVPELYERWRPTDRYEYHQQVSSYQGGSELFTEDKFISYFERGNAIICGDPVEFGSSSEADYELLSLHTDGWKRDAQGNIVTTYSSEDTEPSQTFSLNGESCTQQEFLDVINIEQAYSIEFSWDATTAVRILDTFSNGQTDVSAYPEIYLNAINNNDNLSSASQFALLELDSENPVLIATDYDNELYTVYTCYRGVLCQVASLTMMEGGSRSGYSLGDHHIFFIHSTGGFNSMTETVIRNGLLVATRRSGSQPADGRWGSGELFFYYDGDIIVPESEDVFIDIDTRSDYQLFSDTPLTYLSAFRESLLKLDPDYNKLAAGQYGFLRETACYLGNDVFGIYNSNVQIPVDLDQNAAYEAIKSSFRGVIWYFYEVIFYGNYPLNDTGTQQPNTLKEIYQIPTDLITQYCQDFWNQTPDFSELPSEEVGEFYSANGQLYGMYEDGNTLYAELRDIKDENGQLVLTYRTGEEGNIDKYWNTVVLYLSPASNPDGYTISRVQIQ